MAEKISMVRINNTKPTVLHIPVGVKPSKDDPKAMINAEGNNVKVMQPREMIMLNPGGNNVPMDKWAFSKEHHVVKQWLELGLLTEGKAADVNKPEGPAIPKSLDSYSAETAAAIVSSTEDQNALKGWLKNEKRPEVVTALKGQLATLSGAPKKTDDAK